MHGGRVLRPVAALQPATPTSAAILSGLWICKCSCCLTGSAGCGGPVWSPQATVSAQAFLTISRTREAVKYMGANLTTMSAHY